MTDIILILILGVILGSAISYIIKEKKAGVRCVGCSFAGRCGGSCDEESDVDTNLTGNSLVAQYHKDYKMKVSE